MTQYQQTNTSAVREKPRPLTPTLNPEIEELQKKLVTLYMMIEKVRRDNNRLSNEIDELRTYVRNHR